VGALTSIELSREQKKVIFQSGHTIKGVFNVGFRFLYIDKATPQEARIKELQERSDMQQRILTRMRMRISELEEKLNVLEKTNPGKK